ncbi:splicing factor, arginine/serine-rich 19-like isoform X2 [Pomacea canaliculata]|uniref:splicing factor, arginine/serine-rich 19-like isoform X2 n=1 Tax=Pomacea canaliculata TaxID=400727 RepID=UPI000D72F3FF|nr:splicing factor, arginine/serine-rich 19-like isoform X2 [Pomacea canaliculata]
MSLPPADELSRWTVNQVNTWLSQNSLTAFREAFLSDSIDGSKLMRMKPTDIDQRYHSIPPKKRSVLKEILSKLDTSPRPSATWNSTPPLPPRPKPPPSNPSPDESDEDDNGWSDSFTDDDSPGDYVEPTSAPSGAVSNSLNQNAPSKSGGMDELEVYEQVEEETQSYGLDRKTSLFCKLKTALNQRQQVKQDPSNSDSDGESYLEPVSGPPNETEGTPPPRPPKH